MRKETTTLAERTLMKAIGGQLFDQAPNRQPRKAEIIMAKVRDAFREDAINFNEYYYMKVPDVYKYVKELLMSIPEFKELNLSQNEFEKRIDVDDPSRPKFAFSSRYDKETSESWRRDFIDLDAFIRNATNNIYSEIDLETDCFGCVNKGTSKCNECYVNESFKNNYLGDRKPKGIYTFACKYDCPKGYYICCEECKHDCNTKCSSSSKECGQAINHR